VGRRFRTRILIVIQLRAKRHAFLGRKTGLGEKPRGEKERRGGWPYSVARRIFLIVGDVRSTTRPRGGGRRDMGKEHYYLRPLWSALRPEGLEKRKGRQARETLENAVNEKEEGLL